MILCKVWLCFFLVITMSLDKLHDFLLARDIYLGLSERCCSNCYCVRLLSTFRSQGKGLVWACDQSCTRAVERLERDGKGSLMLYYTHSGSEQDDTRKKQIGDDIFQAAQEAGFEVDWDGNISKAIKVVLTPSAYDGVWGAALVRYRDAIITKERTEGLAQPDEFKFDREISK